jgi:hypothetical protein
VSGAALLAAGDAPVAAGGVRTGHALRCAVEATSQATVPAPSALVITDNSCHLQGVVDIVGDDAGVVALVAVPATGRDVDGYWTVVSDSVMATGRGCVADVTVTAGHTTYAGYLILTLDAKRRRLIGWLCVSRITTIALRLDVHPTAHEE